eukprot:7037825-Prymnesium_polylepis.1
MSLLRLTCIRPMLRPTVGGILPGGSGSSPVYMPLSCSSSVCRAHGGNARPRAAQAPLFSGRARAHRDPSLRAPAPRVGAARLGWAWRTVLPARSTPRMSTWNSAFRKKSFQKP